MKEQRAFLGWLSPKTKEIANTVFVSEELMNNPNTLNSKPLRVLRKEKKASIVAIVLFVIKAELLTSVLKISDAFMRTGNLLCYFQQNFGLLR